MSAHIHSLPAAFGAAYVRVAQVIRSAPHQIYRVRLEYQGRMQEISAHLAIPLSFSLEAGNRVLVAGESQSLAYIIGVLDAGPQAVRTTGGAGARVQGEDSDQYIVVHDEQNRPIFEYHPEKGCCVVKAPQGDLQLDAPNGHIDLRAGRGVRFRAEEQVTLSSAQSVRIAAGRRDNPYVQELCLDQGGIHLDVHEVDVTAGQGDIRIARAVYRGKQLQSTVDRAKMIYGKLEISARRIWERSGQVLRTVQHLCQIQAGRLRTLVHGAHHVQSERTTIIAKKEVRIDGEKINLG